MFHTEKIFTIKRDDDNTEYPWVVTCVTHGFKCLQTHRKALLFVEQHFLDFHSQEPGARSRLHAAGGGGKSYAPIPVEPRVDPKCTCYRSMTTGKFEYGHQYPCKGGER